MYFENGLFMLENIRISAIFIDKKHINMIYLVII